MKAYLVDTLGTVVFFTIVAGLSELLIAGLAPQQVLIARAITIPVMVLTARPYGMWRDWVFGRFVPVRPVARIVIDILAFLTFQVPVYVATLIVSGATLAEVFAAVSAAIVFMVLLSRPFGLYLEWLRRVAGTTACRLS